MHLLCSYFETGNTTLSYRQECSCKVRDLWQISFFKLIHQKLLTVQVHVLSSMLGSLFSSKCSAFDKSAASIITVVIIFKICRPAGRDNAVKLKAMNETVLRLNKSNEQLQAENRALKEDLKNALEDGPDKAHSSKFDGYFKKAQTVNMICC